MSYRLAYRWSNPASQLKQIIFEVKGNFPVTEIAVFVS